MNATFRASHRATEFLSKSLPFQRRVFGNAFHKATLQQSEHISDTHNASFRKAGHTHPLESFC